MIRFALVVASVLGFVLTAALGNMMVPLLRELQRAARGTPVSYTHLTLPTIYSV